ncbi:MAG: hypothetical protein IH948_05175 [Bacteroidetes bacterium]|nr:hypothetical protein [Bacteroidota bacterium]
MPKTKLGRDVDFIDVINNWGFSTVLLAIGAWNDRPLNIDGIDEYINKGLYYQNPLSQWFNHYHESNYQGRKHEIVDGAIIIGGGLASIDIAKIVMMETVKDKLSERGIETNILELDRGIDRILEANNLRFEDLDLKGCTLYYRRRAIDMPLTPMTTETPELLQKAQGVRLKVLNNFMNKFFFKFQECRIPVNKVVKDDRLTGIVFGETRIEDEKVVKLEGKNHVVQAPLIVSSIGSIPEPIAGIESDGQAYKIDNHDSCRIAGFDNVFAVGNAVTGRGNIKASFHHSVEISQKIMNEYLDWTETNFEEVLRAKESGAAEAVSSAINSLNKTNLLSVEQLATIDGKVKEAQQKVGYDGDFGKWIENHLPERLENIT